MNVLKTLRAQAGRVKENFVEGYTLALITIGLPLIAYVYVDLELALTVFIVTQILLGILAIWARSTTRARK